MRRKPKVFARTLLVACACSFLLPAHAEDSAKLTTQTELIMGPESGETPESIQLDAVKGNAEAQFSLGHMYTKGHGVPKNIPSAIKWYRRAAEQGNVKAMYALFYAYYMGKGVELNRTMGLEWLRKAADKGYDVAQYELGVVYKNKIKSSKDEENKKKALEWFHKAAKQDNQQARRAIAEMSMDGRNQITALTEDDVDTEDAKTQYMLAGKYARGRGCKQDKQKAIEWYTKAAEQDLNEAMNDLAWLYATSKEPEIRNGAKALEYANNAMKRASKEPETIDTLAAAYAANNQFDEAAKEEKRAIALFKLKGNNGEAQNAEKRLKLYEAKQPYLE